MDRSPNRKFDNKIKYTLENASVKPPAFLWNTIESKLPANKNWYSRYKYLLLLLMLGATSAGSIFIYKNVVLKNDINNLSQNKNVLNDGSTTDNEKEISASTVLNKVAKEEKNNKSITSSDNINNKSSVASFYTLDKDGNENTASLFAKKQTAEKASREARLKRLEVKTENNESGIKTQYESVNVTKEENKSLLVLAVSKRIVKNKNNISSSVNNSSDKHIDGIQNNNVIKTIGTVIDDNNNSDYSNILVTTAAIDKTVVQQSSSSATEDVTTPINESLRKEEEPLTASIVPVKIQQSPIPGREILRSMIELEKLEQLDIKSQAAGINDLNPNKEKMLKNLKQFAGYDINKGFHFGAFIGINNIWLNKKQYSANENTTSIKPKVQFGKSYGVNIGYDYTDRWGIQLELQVSEQGQKYSITQTSDNDKHTKDINLLYLKFPLMLKYKQMFINNYNSKPIAVSFLFGPQFGFLMKKNVQLDGKDVKGAPQYNKGEFGILGGLDFDLFMTRNIALTIGGRTGFSSSMRKGQPMSFQLGITTQLNFRFPKKIK